MGSQRDETSDVICLERFEENRRYQGKVLKGINAAICAMLNSNGGSVVIHFETSRGHIPVEGFPFSKISSVIRRLEQCMISIIGENLTASKINISYDKDSIIISIQKADSLITANYELYLPGQEQILKMSPWVPLESIKNDIICREAIPNPVKLGSHCRVFLKHENCGFRESKIYQFKKMRTSSNKISLADRIASEHNKFSCYVSAFANHCGGHVFYGITDEGVVEGEFIQNEKDREEIINKVEKRMQMMVWPEQIGLPKRGQQWEIFFEPVVDANSKPVPSTFVIVISIAPCLGGVFTEAPECYEMVEGNVCKMSFATWKKRISQPVRLQKSQKNKNNSDSVEGITWSSEGTLENQSSAEETTLDSHTPVEQIDELIEEASNPSRTERLPNDDLIRLEKCIKEYSASYAYTHRASSKDPFSEKVRKSMTRNVKSLAYKNLLGRNIGKDERNTGKFVDDDQQIIHLARDELNKHKSTLKPAILRHRLSASIKSIGRISCGNAAGTCWIVSGTLVIICHHVYQSFVQERIQLPNSTLPIEVSFDYFHPQQSEHIHKIEVDEDRDPEIENAQLDYKFLRLKENEALSGRGGLGQLVRNRSLQEGLVTIVGHPGGNVMHEETCVVVRNFSWRKQLEQRQINSIGLHMTNDDRLRAEKYQEQGCLPYDTTLFSGSSGSPVFDVNGNIVAMHLQGYTLDIDDKGKYSLMEFGVQFGAICEDLRRRNFSPEDYFPNYNLSTNEERMDEDIPDNSKEYSLMEFGVKVKAACEDVRRRNFNPDDNFPGVKEDKTSEKVVDFNDSEPEFKDCYTEKETKAFCEEGPITETKSNKEDIINDEEKICQRFEDIFVDSKHKLKKEVHEKLASFSWLSGAYGLTAPTKKIARPHIYLTVKRGMKKSDVRHDLEDKFKCDAKLYFELLQEPIRKPTIEYLGKCSSTLRPKWMKSSSLLPAPGGGVLACVRNSSNTANDLRVPEENERHDLPEGQGTGTLTMFCASNNEHYALTCFHVGCATDETQLNATLNKKEDIEAIRSSLPTYVQHAMEQQYYFAEKVAANNNDLISFGDDGRKYTQLGDFHNYRFDNNCDIMSLKIAANTKIKCEMTGVASPNWYNIWKELYKRVYNHDTVNVEKTGFSSDVSYGRIISCDVSYKLGAELLFQNALAVKGYNGPFLKGGDSGCPVFFEDKNDRKQIFAYGVCEMDELPIIKRHESISSSSHKTTQAEKATTFSNDNSDDDNDNSSAWSEDESDDSEIQFQEDSGGYFICLRLDTALEELELQEAAICVSECSLKR